MAEKESGQEKRLREWEEAAENPETKKRCGALGNEE